MERPPSSQVAGMVRDARAALGMSRDELAAAVESSFRTVGRWERGQSLPTDAHVVAIVRLLHPVDRDLAEYAASLILETLVSLGLEQPRPPPPPPGPPPRPQTSPADLTDIVVCAAAEASRGTPADLWAPLLAAFRKARLIGLTYEEAEEALAARIAPPPTAALAPKRAKKGD